MEAHLNSDDFAAHLDRINFVRKLSLTHTLASILVLIGTVQNPTRKGDPVIQRQPGLRGTRFEVAPSWLGMGYGRGESRAQIRIAGRGRKSATIEGHNFLITGCAGTCCHFVATGALEF